MRRRGTGLGLLTAGLCVIVGCQKEPYLRPPKPPDTLVAAPVDDPRYSQPPEYPKNVLNEDRIKKPTSDKDGATGTMPRGGMNRPGGPSSTY